MSEFCFETMQAELMRIRAQYPFIDLFEIGKSCLGKEIYCVRWGRGGKKVFLNGAHHGLEWITSLFLLKALEALCVHYQKPAPLLGENIRKLYRKITFYMVPMVNPDGVNIAQKGVGGLPFAWAERILRYNGGNPVFKDVWQANARGVDVNHNYNANFETGVEFAKELGIFAPGPTRYGGELYESEPETKALVRFTRMCRPDLVIAYHAQGEVIYYDYNNLAGARAKQIAQRLAYVSGYALEEPDGIASFSGYKDWVISELRIPACTVEVGRGKNPVDVGQLEKIYADNIHMLVDMANW
jgi:g-D-glutamyl-meso-diaminopimelate peptidase